jgi:hypothetical protein
MTKHGSDKGRLWHNYTTIYSVLFNGYRDRPLSIFELGLGTNNPTLVSSMGGTGRPGASLRGWRELFPRAFIYGADIDRTILFRENKIETFYCDQLDQASIRDLWDLPALRGGVDIILEDGLHTLDANVSFLDVSLEHLRPGGTYVVEDICTDNIEKWRNLLETIYSKQYPDYEFALTILPNLVNHQDNNLLIIRRKTVLTSDQGELLTAPEAKEGQPPRGLVRCSLLRAARYYSAMHRSPSSGASLRPLTWRN